MSVPETIPDRNEAAKVNGHKVTGRMELTFSTADRELLAAMIEKLDQLMSLIASMALVGEDEEIN